jgi:putative membrane fusion protein
MKRKTRLFIFAFLAAALLLYCGVFVIPKMLGLMEKTQILEYDSVPVSDKVSVYIVRTETLYLADVSGNVERINKEGTKLRKGIPIVTISPVDGQNEGESEDTIAEGNEESAYTEIKSVAGESAIENPGNVAPFTGVVSYYADGYENRLSPEKLDDLKLDDLAGVPAEGVDLVRSYTVSGDPLYKMTDNKTWYMVYWIPIAEAKHDYYDSGSVTKVNLGKTVVTAVVNSAVKDGDYYKVVLRSDVYYRDLARQRKLDVEVEFDRYEGLIVDKSCIVKRAEGDGVFVKQRNESFKWVPVKVEKQIEGNCVLKAGTYYDGKGETVVTVSYYDEVLLNPKAEGYK